MNSIQLRINSVFFIERAAICNIAYFSYLEESWITGPNMKNGKVLREFDPSENKAIVLSTPSLCSILLQRNINVVTSNKQRSKIQYFPTGRCSGAAAVLKLYLHDHEFLPFRMPVTIYLKYLGQ